MWTIAAIPTPEEYVWKVSSEKIPHLTICVFDETHLQDRQTELSEFLRHAIDSQLQIFELEVIRRGPLGPDDADVLFFGDYNMRKLKDFRNSLLQNSDIQLGYNAVEQYPEWTPHLTLGYPTTPAHKDSREYPGISWVKFGSIALWTDDFAGETFNLKAKQEVDALAQQETLGERAVGNFLEHYGKKGMKWGVRKRDTTPTDVAVQTKPGKLVKAKGGKFQAPSEDAIRAAMIRQRAKKSSIDSLSNKELQELVNRMNLEQQFHRLKNDPNRTILGVRVAKAALDGGAADLAVSGLGQAAARAGKASNPQVVAGLKIAGMMAKAAGPKKKK